MRDLIRMITGHDAAPWRAEGDDAAEFSLRLRLCAITIEAPADWPNSVTAAGSPPKFAMFA